MNRLTLQTIYCGLLTKQNKKDFDKKKKTPKTLTFNFNNGL